MTCRWPLPFVMLTVEAFAGHAHFSVLYWGSAACAEAKIVPLATRTRVAHSDDSARGMIDIEI